jgi:hypothetical protein
MLSRRQLLRTFGGAALALPFFSLLHGQKARASGAAKRVIFFYFPDGVAGQSQNGDPSLWHATGSEKAFQLTQLLDPLTQYKDDCVFLNGLSMGGTDSGSHPGGAKKLLTATDGGNGTSIDQALAGTFGAQAPFRHLYLGAMANQDNASGDKHISYPSPGQSLPPTDDPRQAFDMLFGHAMGGPMMGGKPDPVKVSVIDGVLADMKRLQGDLGSVEKQKLDVHLDALREVEKRIKNVQMPSASCDKPSIDTSTINDQNLEDSARFPDILKAQIDLMVLAMSCGLTDVGTIQASHHTSDLVMSRFPNTEMYDPNFDMRSHQASHYGAAHDFQKKEFKAFVAQIRWWVSQFAYLVGALKAQPEGGGTMLDNTLLLLCSEICDGNTHLHDNMPFVLAGRAGGALQTGRLLDYSGQRHANLLLSIAHATGQMWPSFGDASSGGLSGLL